MKNKYLCFTKDHNLENALQIFRDCYHLEPKGYKYEFELLWIGPIPGSDAPMFAVIEEFPSNSEEAMQLVML
jgi:hypothetical protein